nr:alpha-amylase 3, chloroplastic [Tanacetum cinerariifolium]
SHTTPNIDHSLDFLRNNLCEWLRWLTIFGYDGWRLAREEKEGKKLIRFHVYLFVDPTIDLLSSCLIRVA